MTSLETLQQIGTLMSKAKTAYKRLMAAQRQVIAIRNYHSQRHRENLIKKLNLLGDAQQKTEAQFRQIITILHQQYFVGRPQKQFNDGDPFRNDITPKAGSASAALRYPPKQRAQQVLI